MIRRRLALTASLLAGSLAFATALSPALGAQDAAQEAARAPGDSVARGAASAGQPLFTRRDAAIAGGFAALTVAMFPLDRHLAHELRDSTVQANRFLGRASRGVEVLADPGSIVIGVSMYALGRVAGWREVADLGLHGTEAVVVAGGVTTILKGLAGRARPYASRDTNPADFRAGRGFTGGNRYESFPSGHTTVAFAAAAAVTSESRRWWPGGTWLVAPVMYGGATLVGLSRMYHDAHWASDVALGAAIGTFGGLKVVRYSHAHPGNVIDRVLLPARVAAMPGGGGALWWSLPIGRSPAGGP